MEPRVVGRYAIMDEIASGGMAAVHLGRLLGGAGFARTVAIKRLHPQFARDPDFVAMLLDEARLASRIRHPNVVTTLDVVQEGDEVLLVMEYVVGESLARLLRAARPGRMPLDVVVAVMSSVLHGLHAAHEATTEAGELLGIVHRDVSPQNILVGTDGVARVLDFGIAKAAYRAQTTREGQLKGKLAYMAPEQLRRDEVDRRTDVYAAAVVLWEALTGARLFEAKSEAAVVTRVLTEPVASPRAIVPEIPAALEAVVMKGLAREAEERFGSAREMAIAIESAGVSAAPAWKVGEYVEGLARASLSERSARVAVLEQHPMAGAPSSRRLVVPAAPEPGPPASIDGATRSITAITQSVSDAIRAGRSRRPWVKIAVPAVLVAGALGIGAWRVAPVAAPSPEPPPVAATPPPPAAPPASPAPAESTAAADPAAPSISPPEAAPTASSPRKREAPKPPPPRTAPVKPPVKKAPAPSCTPPYTIDAAGVRHIKPECM